MSGWRAGDLSRLGVDKVLTVFFFWNAGLRGVYAVFRGGFHTSGEPAIYRGPASDKVLTVFFFWNAELRSVFAVFRSVSNSKTLF